MRMTRYVEVTRLRWRTSRPTDRPIVTVCARGRTSEIAAKLLRERGLDAYSLSGGMKAWSLAWNTAEIVNAQAVLIQFRRTGKG